MNQKPGFFRVLEICICMILWFLQRILIAEPCIKTGAVWTSGRLLAGYGQGLEKFTEFRALSQDGRRI